MDKNNIDIVIYCNSLDSFASAFVVWQYYKNQLTTNSIKFILNDPMVNIIKQVTNKNILICGINYKREQLDQLVAVSKSLLVLDHHENKNDDDVDLENSDIKLSSLYLTWIFFYPNVQLPLFLKYVQCMIVRKRYNKSYVILKNISEFIVFFKEQELNFELWETYFDKNNINNAIQKGMYWQEYHNKLISKIIKKTTCIIQEIGDQYFVIIYCNYCNSSGLKSDVGNKIFDELPIGDFLCMWNYDSYKNRTTYNLFSTENRSDVSEIAIKLGGKGHQKISKIVFSELINLLPYPKIDDFDIVPLISNGIKGTCILEKTNKYTYILFKIDIIHKEWFQEKYLNLIKKKCYDSVLIVFEKQSDIVDFNPKTNEILPIKDYNIFFNEKASVPLVKQLQYSVCGFKDQIITFRTSKNFTELFMNNINL